MLVDIAAMFAAIMAKQNGADLMMFADTAQYVPYNPDDTLATIQRAISSRIGEVGYGTNFNACFYTMENRVYDRIMFFSDMQGWVGDGFHYGSRFHFAKAGGVGAPIRTHKDYKVRTMSNPKIYSIDLAGYGSLMFPEDNIFALSGFSEKIFEIMSFLENDMEALVHTIEEVELE